MILVCAALATTLAWPPRVAGAAPAESGVPLDVDATQVTEDRAAYVEGEIVEQSKERRRLEAPGAKIELRIEAIEGRDFEYVVRVEAERKGFDVAEVEPTTCAPCNEAMLIEQGLGRIDAALEAVRQAEPRRSDAPPRPAANRSDRDLRAIGGLGIAGSVVVVAGVGASIAGALLFARRVEKDVRDGREVLTDHRRNGALVLGLGISATVIGTLMLAGDLVHRGRQRRAAFERAAIAPVLGEQVGIAVSGRF